MLWDHLVNKSGPMTYPTAQTALFARSTPECVTPDLQYHFSNYSIDSETREIHDFPGITYSVCNLRPESRGEILLRSADPADHPVIQPNYLNTAADCDAAIRCGFSSAQGNWRRKSLGNRCIGHAIISVR